MKHIHHRVLFWTLSIVILAALFTAGIVPVRSAAAGSGDLALDSGGRAILRALQQSPDTDKLVIGGSYRLEEGETLPGNLIVIGGAAKLLAGSNVAGDVVIVGGTLQVDGAVEGDVNAIGGLVSLGDSARVQGDVNTVSAKLNLAENAQIQGQVNDVPAGPFSMIVPGTLRLPDWEGAPPINLPGDLRTPVVDLGLNPLWDALWWFIRSFFWAALAVLVALFAPKPINRVSKTALDSILASGGLGCLTILIVPLILVLLAVTICLLPLSLIGALLLWLGWVFGIIAIGAEIGKRLEGFLKVDWALPVSAGVGAFLLTLVSNGIQMIVPCIGWLAPVLIGTIGLGAVLLTRFGARAYPDALPAASAEATLPLPAGDLPSNISDEPEDAPNDLSENKLD
ncbi:MAG: hypothetical protein B6D39_09575 [Anaerolineae bacterium UTCFX2]|jgi:hypothetical protein|nr:polymer-forming cytoskeletal protein [Anaerolineae bacterium]MCZ7551274.1 polymer-forming cytoskeletal protein [Anaerolineales bacterium]OQY89468.1 MAG: hypothetical protein B6D39_09575 [Anaerolineae bacterium UTCFX2]